MFIRSVQICFYRAAARSQIIYESGVQGLYLRLKKEVLYAPHVES